MCGTLAIVSPTGTDFVAGATFASLESLPPCALALTDGGAGTAVSVTLDSTTTLFALSAGDATVSGSDGALTIAGDRGKVGQGWLPRATGDWGVWMEASAELAVSTRAAPEPRHSRPCAALGARLSTGI